MLNSIRSLIKKLGIDITVDERLHKAVLDDNMTLVDELLTEGCDINNVIEGETTALHIAVFINNLEMVNILLACGADPNLKNSRDGVTPLHIACAANQPEIVNQLLKAGANANIMSKSNKSSLVYAINAKNILIITELLKHGANLNINQLSYIEGNISYPMNILAMLLFKDDSSEILKILLKWGADPYHIMSHNKSSFDLALEFRKFDYWDLMQRSQFNVKNPATIIKFLTTENLDALAEPHKSFMHRYYFYALTTELHSCDASKVIYHLKYIKHSGIYCDLDNIKTTIVQSFENRDYKRSVETDFDRLNEYLKSASQGLQHDLISGVYDLIEEHYYKVCIYNIISLRKTLGLVCKNFEATWLNTCVILPEISYLVISVAYSPFPFKTDESLYMIVATKYDSLKIQYKYNKHYLPKTLICDIFEEVKENQLQSSQLG